MIQRDVPVGLYAQRIPRLQKIFQRDPLSRRQRRTAVRTDKIPHLNVISDVCLQRTARLQIPTDRQIPSRCQRRTAARNDVSADYEIMIRRRREVAFLCCNTVVKFRRALFGNRIDILSGCDSFPVGDITRLR